MRKGVLEARSDSDRVAESDGGSNVCSILERMLCVSLKLVELLCSQVIESVFEGERES